MQMWSRLWPPSPLRSVPVRSAPRWSSHWLPLFKGLPLRVTPWPPLQKDYRPMEGPDKVCSVDGPDGISPGLHRSQTITSPGRLGPALVLPPYQSITFGFVRLMVWNCLLLIATRSGLNGGWVRMGGRCLVLGCCCVVVLLCVYCCPFRTLGGLPCCLVVGFFVSLWLSKCRVCVCGFIYCSLKGHSCEL